jgi:hypothetical protein
MAGANFSDLQTWGMLKDLYSDDVQFMEHIKSSLYNFIRHARDGEVEFDGLSFKLPLKITLNESYAALNDGERLPEAQITKGVFAQYSPKRMYSSIEATNFAATRGHKNGRPNGKYIDDLMKGTLMTMLSNVDFDLYANGRGYRAEVSAVVGGAGSFTAVTSMWLRPGMKLDWWNSTYTVKRGSIMISERGIDRMSRAVFIDTAFGLGAAPAAAVAGDRLTVYGAIDALEPTDGRYIAGMDRLTDNTVAVGGFTGANYAAWQAVVTNAGGANPSQELLQQHWDHMYQISGMYPDRFVFAPSWKRGYLQPFLNQRMFTSNSFDTGATKLTFDPLKMGSDEKNTKPAQFQMLEDKNCPPTTNYIWAYEAFCLASDYADAPHLADEDGSELRLRDGYDVLHGFYRYWANTVVNQRNGLGRIFNYATPASVL